MAKAEKAEKAQSPAPVEPLARAAVRPAARAAPARAAEPVRRVEPVRRAQPARQAARAWPVERALAPAAAVPSRLPAAEPTRTAVVVARCPAAPSVAGCHCSRR